MLLDFSGGQLRLNGVEVPASSSGSITLRPYRGSEYLLSHGRSEAHADQQRIYANAPRAEVVVHTSWFGEYPLFYHLGQRSILLSSSLKELHSHLHQRHIDLEFDRIAFFEMLLLDHPLRERTLFRNICKMLPGKRYRFDLLADRHQIEDAFILPFHTGRNNRDERGFLKDAKDTLTGLLPTTELQNAGSMFLPLSGGLDSRLLACLLKKHGVEFRAAVFGPVESTERFVAHRVAKSLGIELESLPLRNEFYKTYGNEVTLLTGGLSSHRHCHLYACLKENQIEADVILHGYLGGEYAGASQRAVAQQYGMAKDAALDHFVRDHMQRKFIWPMLPESDRQEIMADLRLIMEECCRVNLPCHFDEYVHNVERQFSLIANVFSVCEEFGCFMRPFARREYAAFFNALPYRYRQERYLFRKACTELFPEQFNIGTPSQIYPKHALLGWIEAAASRIVSVASFASFVATQSHLVLPCPKSYERHRQVLFGVLRRDFMTALCEMSSFTGVDLMPLGRISACNRNELTAQFRILSSHLTKRNLLEDHRDFRTCRWESECQTLNALR